MKQRTIKNSVNIDGIGIHTGENIKVTFYPAPVNAGIIFKRVDVDGSPEINASFNNVVNSKREVTLKKHNIEIHTIEHLMATLSALKITNLFVEISGPELPIGDGSAIHFFKILKKAEIVNQDEEQKSFVCTEPIYVQEDDKYLIMLPSNELKITFTVDYEDQPVIGTQFASFIINENIFEMEIAKARTFGFLHEVKELWANNLAQGGSLDNAVVIGKNNILNGELRYPNELVRHKILDLLGDLYLLGMPVTAHIIGIKSGHYMNMKLVEKLFEKI